MKKNEIAEKHEHHEIGIPLNHPFKWVIKGKNSDAVPRCGGREKKMHKVKAQFFFARQTAVCALCANQWKRDRHAKHFGLAGPHGWRNQNKKNNTQKQTKTTQPTNTQETQTKQKQDHLKHTNSTEAALGGDKSETMTCYIKHINRARHMSFNGHNTTEKLLQNQAKRETKTQKKIPAREATGSFLSWYWAGSLWAWIAASGLLIYQPSCIRLHPIASVSYTL